MLRKFRQSAQDVHCRIGSLETVKNCTSQVVDVHCRIGSLEKLY